MKQKSGCRFTVTVSTRCRVCVRPSPCLLCGAAPRWRRRGTAAAPTWRRHDAYLIPTAHTRPRRLSRRDAPLTHALRSDLEQTALIGGGHVSGSHVQYANGSSRPGPGPRRRRRNLTCSLTSIRRILCACLLSTKVQLECNVRQRGAGKTRRSASGVSISISKWSVRSTGEVQSVADSSSSDACSRGSVRMYRCGVPWPRRRSHSRWRWRQCLRTASVDA